MREEPDGGRPQRHFLKQSVVAALTIDKATCLPRRQRTFLERFFRVHIPDAPFRLRRQRIAILPPLVRACGVKHFPVDIFRKAREIVLQPAGVILFAHAAEPPRPENIQRPEACRLRLLFWRYHAPFERFDIRQTTKLMPLVDFRSEPDAVRVFFITFAAVGAAPVETHLIKRPGHRHFAARPVAIAKDSQRFTEVLHIYTHCAGGFFLLMVGVGMAGRQKLGAHFRDGHVDNPTAGLQLPRRQLP